MLLPIPSKGARVSAHWITVAGSKLSKWLPSALSQLNFGVVDASLCSACRFRKGSQPQYLAVTKH